MLNKYNDVINNTGNQCECLAYTLLSIKTIQVTVFSVAIRGFHPVLTVLIFRLNKVAVIFTRNR